MCRAPAVVISYLMKKRGWRLAESYRWVKDKRPSIKIQAGPSFLLLGGDLTGSRAESHASCRARGLNHS